MSDTFDELSYIKRLEALSDEEAKAMEEGRHEDAQIIKQQILAHVREQYAKDPYRFFCGTRYMRLSRRARGLPEVPPRQK